MTLSPMAIRRVRRELAKRRPEEPTPGGGELNIVPFLDIVTNLLLFLLATVSAVVVVGQVDAQLPATRPHGHGRGPQTISVTLTERGTVIASPGGFVEPGCASASRASTIAVARGDWDALSRCIAAVHARAGEDRVIVSADPTIPYEDVIHAMDALRARGDQPLFGEILISAGVR